MPIWTVIALFTTPAHIHCVCIIHYCRRFFPKLNIGPHMNSHGNSDIYMQTRDQAPRTKVKLKWFLILNNVNLNTKIGPWP